MTTPTAEDGYTAITPMFVDTSSDTQYKLSDIAGDFSMYDSIQLFGNGGDVETEYVYRKVGGVLGWWFEGDEGWESAENVTFPLGKSFWLSTSSEIDVTMSGAVRDKPFSATFGEGYTPTGNPMAVGVRIGDIEFDGQEMYDSIQVFGNGGDVETEYVYRKVGGVLGWWFEGDEGWESAENVVLAPGAAFWYSASSEGVTMTINPPSL